MHRISPLRHVATLTLFLVLGLAPAAQGQERFPSKPVNLLVPFGPGSATDNVARSMADSLARELGQPVVTTNRLGANGMIAIRAAQAAPADGYTLLFLANGVVIDQVVKKTGFDYRKELLPVARVVQAPQGLFVSNSLPVNSMRELVEYARRNPGKINYATAGVASIAHVNTERLLLAIGAKMVHVPYPSGTPQIVTAMIAGDVGVFINEMGSLKGFVQEKKVKLIATLADRRNPIYPDAPAISETGVPEVRNFGAAFFFGVLAPAGVPAERVEFLNRAINKVLKEPALQQRMVSLGYSPENIGGMSTAQFSALLAAELARTEVVVREAKIEAPAS